MLSTEERRVKWRGLLEDQRLSGLPVTAWCRKHGIEKNTYYGWRKRLAASPSPVPSPTSPQWLPVSVTDHPVLAKAGCGCASRDCRSAPPDCCPISNTGLTLRIGRVAVEVSSGFDRALLSDVLNVLECRIPC